MGLDIYRGHAVVVQPSEGASYWQPIPAGGHADPKLSPSTTGFHGFSMGYQTIAAGGRVREHSHRAQVELLVCFRGRGRVILNALSHPLIPGTACLLGADVVHEVVNDADEDLVMMWLITPPGLEDFFAAIGRPRHAGEPTPAPFPRPTDVIAIERARGMDNTRV